MAYTTIDDPSAYFQTALYTGNSSTNVITNDGNSDLQADWIWLKERSSTSYHHVFDSTRGVGGSGKALYPNDTSAEGDDTAFTSFDSDGFTLANTGGFNESGVTNVAWQWKANGGTTSSNTDGSITSTVQANTTAGFSIVTYTGNGTVADSNTNVGHGLSQALDLLIIKDRDASVNWNVWHKDFSGSEVAYLNLTNAKNSDGNVWANSPPTSSVFYVGNSEVNANTRNYVAYCFAEKQGYSKFGSYTGNGSEDGPFVYTGFKPQWIMFKNTGAAEEWVLQDTTRNPNNPVTKNIRVDSNIAEADASNIDIDFLSNGFKNRSDQAQVNSNGVVYIYMAFAEHPFVSSEGVPVTAR